MIVRGIFLFFFSLFITGCPAYFVPVTIVGKAFVKGEQRDATLIWDRNLKTVLIKVLPNVSADYTARFTFCFNEQNLEVEKIQVTDQISSFLYSTNFQEGGDDIFIHIQEQAKNGDPLWPCGHPEDDQIILIQIKGKLRFLARTFVQREDNPFNKIRYKQYPCP